MAEAGPADPQLPRDAPTLLLAHPQPDRLRAAAAALAREYRVEIAADGAATYEIMACGRCQLAVVAMGLPGLSGLEVLRRLDGLALQRRPLVIAAGAADDMRLQVVRDARLRRRELVVPCPDGVLLRRIWRLLDRELEQRWARLPALQVDGADHARPARRKPAGPSPAGRASPPTSAQPAGSQVVDVLCARLIGDVLAGLRRHHDYTFAHSFRVATHLATFALATGMRRADAELLAQAGLLHDIGKTAIPVGILDKPGPLDSGEWRWCSATRMSRPRCCGARRRCRAT